MDCDCSSCVARGLAPAPHIGDCEACNADGPTVGVWEETGHVKALYEVCHECAESLKEALANIAERRACNDDRCVRGGYEP